MWRRLEFASDLFLDDVHEVIQDVFGWTDCHLHRFGSGPTLYSNETEYYLCPFSADDGDEGVPEEEVRLDEVLVDVGDKLFYVYDFGDDWQHVIRLEAVLARESAAPRAICTGGRRPRPPGRLRRHRRLRTAHRCHRSEPSRSCDSSRRVRQRLRSRHRSGCLGTDTLRCRRDQQDIVRVLRCLKWVGWPSLVMQMTASL